jgi:predicted nuclease of predicted toxin-antitoxin system
MTVRLLTDENFNGDIVAGLRRRIAGLDLVRVQDVGLRTADDPSILAWAARQSRLLITHDAATMMDFAYGRLADGKPMPGVFIVRPTLPIAVAIDELATIVLATEAEEWDDRVVYLPIG